MLNKRLRLREIIDGDFRKSELTQYQAWAKSKSATFGPDDVVCFLSATRSQLLFVYGFIAMEDVTSKPPHTATTALTSVRVRLSNGAFNPLMLKNYAGHAGIELVGIKLFEEHFERMQNTKRGA